MRSLRGFAPAEDPQLRAEAVRLMERAVMLTSPVWPANEEFFHFRVLHPAPGETSEGDMKIGVARPVTKRWEFTYGTYKFLQVPNGPEFATYRSESAEPASLTTTRRLVPAFQGQFDHADVISRISDIEVDGRAARCVDSRSGFLLSVRQGDETIRQSAFFAVNNASLPGHIERWVGNEKLLEIDSKVVVRTEYPPEYFNYPEGASIRHSCREFHRAFAQDTPQPEAKTQSNKVIVVRVHGRIDNDGKPSALKVLDPARADLADEAVRVISKWTYHPAMCEYQPAAMETDFEVWFKGW